MCCKLLKSLRPKPIACYEGASFMVNTQFLCHFTVNFTECDISILRRVANNLPVSRRTLMGNGQCLYGGANRPAVEAVNMAAGFEVMVMCLEVQG